jgi:hypothetical protein
MRNLTLTAIATLIFASLTFAQEVPNFRHGLGYVFYENGLETSGSNTEHLQGLGAGGEFQLRNGLGIGAELAGHSSELGTFSLNPYFHFNQATRDGKWIPFVTAGYTGAGNTEFSENWFNFGGGVDFWPTRRIGARFEVRDSVDTNHSRPLHQIGFRTSLAWR